MGLIEQTSGVAIANRAAAIRDADEVLKAAYEMAVIKTGLDRGVDFEGEPDMAFVHYRGVEAFSMENYCRIEMLLEDIEAADDLDGRVPILSTARNPVDLEDPTIDPGITTYLSVAQKGALALASTVEVRSYVSVAANGKIAPVTWRKLGLKAKTARIGYDIANPNDGFEPLEAGVSDELVLDIRQRVEKDPAGVHNGTNDEIKKARFSQLGSGQLIVGWNEVSGHFASLASRSIEARDDRPEPKEESLGSIESFSQPKQQVIFLKLLTEKLGITRQEIDKIQAGLAEYAGHLLAQSIEELLVPDKTA